MFLKTSQENTCAGIFFNKVAGLLKNGPQYSFPMNLAKFLKINFYKTPPAAASKHLLGMPRCLEINQKIICVNSYFTCFKDVVSL